MTTTSFHASAAQHRGVQAAESVGAGYISLTPRPHSAFAADQGGYLLVTWTPTEAGDSAVSAYRLDGPLSTVADVGDAAAIRTGAVTFATPTETPGVVDFGDHAGVSAAEPVTATGSVAARTVASPNAMLTVREIRSGHLDTVWPLRAVDDRDGISRMLWASCPGISSPVVEVSELLARDGVVEWWDSVFVVESDDVRETGRRVCDRLDVSVTDGYRFMSVQLDDVDSLADLVGVLPHDPSRLRRFGAQLAVNGVATYTHRHSMRGTQTFEVETLRSTLRTPRR